LQHKSGPQEKQRSKVTLAAINLSQFGFAAGDGMRHVFLPRRNLGREMTDEKTKSMRNWTIAGKLLISVESSNLMKVMELNFQNLISFKQRTFPFSELIRTTRSSSAFTHNQHRQLVGWLRKCLIMKFPLTLLEQPWKSERSSVSP